MNLQVLWCLGKIWHYNLIRMSKDVGSILFDCGNSCTGSSLYPYVEWLDPVVSLAPGSVVRVPLTTTVPFVVTLAQLSTVSLDIVGTRSAAVDEFACQSVKVFSSWFDHEIGCGQRATT
ncbi:uncharacterized protein EAE97_008252 [Botrytis byssoidea]|uniref:Uncharacterized protein n=1 Tax=Botrytis byssoidea TaxID=139641 RepID=A0A9P5I9P0_9HELO|nr:uncharacterized protein EAE97_008252 [Botrytis byssoidea]KAF7935345.1 hypothetical protein EAE97_008252 [Botrytis byssoidea]